MIVKIIRKILRDTIFYNICSHYYHWLKLLFMKVKLIQTEVIFLPPLKMIGDYKSQYGQEYYLEKLGILKEKGFFVEVGCNDPILNSNSYYLEKILNWEGVSVDPIDYTNEYKKLRKKTVFINALIDENQGYMDFYEVINKNGWENQVSSIYKETLNMSKGFEANLKNVLTIPLKLIKEINRPIDICMIDVEGHEFSVLNSIDWKNNAPNVFLIENNGEYYSREKLVNFMSNKNYKLLARIGTTDDIYIKNMMKS